MDSPTSKPDIKRFLKAYEGQVNTADIAEDLDSFSCFNEFFYRKCASGWRFRQHCSCCLSDCFACTTHQPVATRCTWLFPSVLQVNCVLMSHR